jgi:DNA-binding PadR family transcriptional regulator
MALPAGRASRKGGVREENCMSLKYALLGLLAESPKYGYELKRRFEGALGNIWSVSYGQLYPTLRRLSELGWVTKKTEQGKKAAEKNIYSMTEKGRKKLDEWLLKPVRSTYRVKDEFTLRFLFFSKLAPFQVLEYLREHQRKTAQQRESFQKTLQSLQGEIDFFLQQIIRKGIFHLEAEDRWLEEVIGEMQNPPPAMQNPPPAMQNPPPAMQNPPPAMQNPPPAMQKGAGSGSG